MSARLTLLSSACLLALCAAGPAAATTVGVAAAVNPAAEGTPPAGSVRTITLGDDVVHNERITTGEAGLVQLLLVDGTSFTVGANSDLTIDKFVYDPAAGTAEVTATLTKGALRFLGGRAAKTGGATINTPIGIVGVRGSGADITPEFVNCTAGTCNLNGVSFPQNQSAMNNGGRVVVVATTPAMAAAASQNFQGSATGNGGASQQTAAQVGTTVQQQQEQGQSASSEAPPPDTSSTTFTAVNQEGETTGDDVTQDSQQGEPTPATPIGPPLNLRVLTAPDVYVTSWGGTIPDTNSSGNNNDPAEVGLVGTAGYDQTLATVLVEQPGDPLLFSAAGDLNEGPSTGPVVLPYRDAATFTTYDVNADFAPVSPFGALTGDYYVNDGFVFYALSYDSGGIDHPFYALGGTPTDFPATFQGTNVRQYSLLADPIQNVPVPFFRDGVISTFSGAAIGDLYVIESPDISPPDSQHVRAIEAWLQISGAGPSQESAVGVTSGDFQIVGEDDEYGFRSGRRGSYRADTTDAASVFYGSLNTVAAPDSGAEVFGPNGTNFVLSTDIAGADAFGDNSVDDSTHFNTVNVANLVNDNVTLTATRSDHDLLGFTAGMVEGGIYGQRAVTSMFSGLGGQEGFRISFDASGNTLGGDLTVEDGFDTSQNESLRLGFGNGYQFVGSGSSTYINDDLFAAGTQGPDGNDEFPHSYVTQDDGSTLRYVEGEFPTTYIVSSDAVDLGPNPAFMGGATICSCTFLEWGWWGGQPRLATLADPQDEVLHESIHLGTWVAGDIVPDHGDLGNVGTVSYAGHVIGTVLVVNPNETTDPNVPGLTQYVAGGEIQLTWDLASRTGTTYIDFDGKQLGGTVADAGLLSGAYFTGDVYGTGLVGVVNGAIVSDVNHTTSTVNTLNAGIIGDIGIYGTNYAATATIAGEVTAPISPPIVPVSLPLRVLTSGAQYTPTNDSNPISNPGDVGIVGDGSDVGEDGNDTVENTVYYYTAGSPPAPSVSTSLILPLERTTSSISIDVNLGDAYDELDNALTGKAFFGPGQFAAYQLVYDDGNLHPYVGVAGIPTTIMPNEATGVFEGTGVRAYALSEDIVQQTPVPFMLDLPAFDWNSWTEGTDYVSTPYYIMNDSHSGDGFAPHALQAWLAIAGSGAAQVSGIGLTTTTVYNEVDDGVGYLLNAGWRGSLRQDASQSSWHLGGGYSTIGNGEANTNQFFGPNAENFVIGTGGFLIDDSGNAVSAALYTGPIDGPGERFGSVHVATLIDEAVPGLGDTRTERSLFGFTAGLVDVVEETGCTSPGNGCTNYDSDRTLATGDIAISFDPQHDRLSATLSVSGTAFGDPATMTLSYGKIEGQDGNGGKSTFIDDDIYAARESNPTTETPYPTYIDTEDTGNIPVELHQRPDEGSNSYLVSADAVPLTNPDFMGGNQFCTQCGFMEWGWWGTQGRFEGRDSPNDSVDVASHLGTWVAGDLTDPGGMPTSGSATYSGQAIGNVANAGETYVAGGHMDMNWNFGSRTGSWDVTNFDGKDFGGAINDPAATPSGTFDGSLSVVGEGGSGSVTGAFANDGATAAAGVLGAFEVNNGTDWSAAGTFMGAQ